MHIDTNAHGILFVLFCFSFLDCLPVCLFVFKHDFNVHLNSFYINSNILHRCENHCAQKDVLNFSSVRYEINITAIAMTRILLETEIKTDMLTGKRITLGLLYD